MLLRKGTKPSPKKKKNKRTFSLPFWFYCVLILGAWGFYTQTSWQDAGRKLRQILSLRQKDVSLDTGLHHRVLFLERENHRLSTLLNFIKGKSGKRILARVETDPRRSWDNTFVVAAGTQQGIRPGQIVFDQMGIWGRIREVTPRRAVVMMVTHPQCCIPIEGIESHCQGIAYGTGRNFLRLEWIGPGSATCPEGEIFVSACHGTQGASGHSLGYLSHDRQHIITTLSQRHPKEVWVILGSSSA